MLLRLVSPCVSIALDVNIATEIEVEGCDDAVESVEDDDDDVVAAVASAAPVSDGVQLSLIELVRDATAVESRIELASKLEPESVDVETIEAEDSMLMLLMLLLLTLRAELVLAVLLSDALLL